MSSGLENINQVLQIVPYVYFKSSSNEMRRNYLTTTYQTCKNHHSSRIFALNHRKNVRRVKAINRVLWQFATSSTMKFSSSTKTRKSLDLFLRWLRSFVHFSTLMTLELADLALGKLRRFLTYDFISNSSLKPPLIMVLRLTLRFFLPFSTLTDLSPPFLTSSELSEKFSSVFDRFVGCRDFLQFYP